MALHLETISMCVMCVCVCVPLSADGGFTVKKLMLQNNV